jgi:tRNA A22 N-methylase
MEHPKSFIWLRDFLIAQGYEVRAAIIFQDNQSSMAIIERGYSNSERTRHINIRHCWIKDRTDAGELTIK